MRVMWITNIPIADMAIHLSTKSGVWMDALFSQLKRRENYTYIIATTWDVQTITKYQEENVEYYLVPGGHASSYKRNEKAAEADWQKIFLEEQPDILQIWGTEYSHSLPALLVAKKIGIPTVIYIQGIMKGISRWADGCVPFWTKLRYTTIRDIYRGQMWIQQSKWFSKRAETEKKLLLLTDNIIVENNWAEIFCKSINSNLNVVKIPLNINDAFYHHDWNIESVNRYSILCNAAGPAYKGIHNLLQALIIVKKQYPKVKLYIPGRSMMVGSNVFNRQKMPGYYSYITDLINRNNLKENVVFTGYFTQEELAIMLSRTHVFVLASSIENHSSSLKEAMAVGTPSIVSQVGGVPEYFEYGNSGFSYRYEEFECIAGYICKLFEDDDLCKQFSIISREKAREITGEDINNMIISMYDQLGLSSNL